MHRILSLSLLAVGAVVLTHEAAHAVFASPIHAGCYLADRGKCRIHVDPFVINVNTGAGRRLSRFQISVNGTQVYRFEVDVSNPPAGNYFVTVPGDFPVKCGTTYVVSMQAQDSGDANLLNAGQVEDVVCPGKKLP
jgi:hypothetical protein